MRGFWDELRENFPKEFSKDIQSLDDRADKAVKDLLAELDRDNLESLLELLRKRRASIDVNPAYNNEIVATSKQILAFGGAGLGLAAGFTRDILALPQPFPYIIGFGALFYFDLILLSLYTVYVFLWQARFRYPFLYLKKAGNAKPFFYYTALSDKTPRDFFQTSQRKLEALQLYMTDFKSFVDDWVNFSKVLPNGSREDKEKQTLPTLESLRQQAKDELQQYFLLLSYQGYVNQHEVKITNRFIFGLLASFISSIVVVTIVAIWEWLS